MKKIKEETTVIKLGYFTRYYRITGYECTECKAKFLDRDDNYQYCPYCGRKIVDNKELVK